MPTYEEAFTFRSDYNRLTSEQRAAFKVGVTKFVADITAMEEGRQTDFRAGLRVKAYRGERGVMEMTWADNGRALWAYGEERVEGLRHIRWLRVGTHDIF